MAERQVSFKRVLNDAIRDGAAGRPEPRRFAARTAGIVSYDNDFGRFDGVRWDRPDALL